jgi:hypothetical protein
MRDISKVRKGLVHPIFQGLSDAMIMSGARNRKGRETRLRESFVPVSAIETKH